MFFLWLTYIYLYVYQYIYGKVGMIITAICWNLMQQNYPKHNTKYGLFLLSHDYLVWATMMGNECLNDDCILKND